MKKKEEKLEVWDDPINKKGGIVVQNLTVSSINFECPPGFSLVAEKVKVEWIDLSITEAKKLYKLLAEALVDNGAVLPKIKGLEPVAKKVVKNPLPSKKSRTSSSTQWPVDKKKPVVLGEL